MASRMAAYAMAAKSASTSSVPISPSSSPSTAKMKSVCASGRLPHFCWLAESPLPKMPPLDMPSRPWPACQPAPWKSLNGSMKLVSRVRRSALDAAR